MGKIILMDFTLSLIFPLWRSHKHIKHCHPMLTCVVRPIFLRRRELFRRNSYYVLNRSWFVVQSSSRWLFVDGIATDLKRLDYTFVDLPWQCSLLSLGNWKPAHAATARRFRKPSYFAPNDYSGTHFAHRSQLDAKLSRQPSWRIRWVLFCILSRLNRTQVLTITTFINVASFQKLDVSEVTKCPTIEGAFSVLSDIP